MKTILNVTIFIAIFTLPAFAVCPITGVCAAPADSVLSSSNLIDKVMPNDLNDYQKPSYFSPQFVKPYDSMKMNSGEPMPVYSPDHTKPPMQYDESCQFGLCLP